MEFVFLFMSLNKYAYWTKEEQDCELTVELLVSRQIDCERKGKASAHTTNKLYVKKKNKLCCYNKFKSKLRGKDSEKATCMTQDHLDKSRTYALLESKPLNPRKTNEFL